MMINRQWAMPNKDTFSVKPIKNLIATIIARLKTKKCLVGWRVVDPFSNGNKHNFATLTNDLDPAVEADFHMDALDFLKTLETCSVDVVLFDPPYSPRQVSECYKKLGKTVNMATTQASYWGNLKKEIGRIAKPDGIVVTCGWNSGGVGKNMGFEIEEILMVAHGGWHNDTIVTVERKIKHG